MSRRGGKGMGSERPHGGRRLHKRGGRERRRGHGVADAVSDGPIPLPPRLCISRSDLIKLNYLRSCAALELACEGFGGGEFAGFGDYLAAEEGVFGEAGEGLALPGGE